MRWNTWRNKRKTAIKTGAWLFLAMGLAQPAFADTPMTAGIIMEKMSSEERAAYISGAIDGLAYARFLKDGKQESGMSCIQNWFYGNDDRAIRQIYQAFDHYSTYPPNVVLYILVKKQCGE